MKTDQIKAGTELQIEMMGKLVSGKMLDNTRGNVRRCEVNGSEAGYFDSSGVIYAYKIKKAKIDGQWVDVVHTPAQEIIADLLDSIL